LRRWALADVGPGRLMPWLAVAFGFGIILYFTAEQEPAIWAAIALAVIAGIGAVLARRRPIAFPLTLAIAAAAAGFATATVKRAMIAHPVLQAPAWNVEIAGFVEAREERERSDRIVVRVHLMDGARITEKPDRVRISVRRGMAPPVGAFVELKAHLSPPLAPLRPGGYDFARDSYFQRIGASGSCSAASARSSLRSRRAYGFATPRRSMHCAKRSTAASGRSCRATKARSRQH